MGATEAAEEAGSTVLLQLEDAEEPSEAPRPTEEHSSLHHEDTEDTAAVLPAGHPTEEPQQGGDQEPEGTAHPPSQQDSPSLYTINEASEDTESEDSDPSTPPPPPAPEDVQQDAPSHCCRGDGPELRAALQSNFQHKYLPGAVRGIYDYWVTEDRLIPMTPEEARQHSKPLTRNYEEGESSASAAARETSPSQEATSSTPLMTAMPPGPVGQGGAASPMAVTPMAEASTAPATQDLHTRSVDC